MSIDTDIRVRDGTGIAAQWSGNLLPPIAFLLQLEIAYMLVPGACRANELLPVHLAHAGALLIALGGTAIAWHLWRKWSADWPEDSPGSEGRSRFMATVALLSGTAFTLVILALWLPTFWLHPCQ